MPNDAPTSSEIEVSLFGPGYGESVLVHTGSNNWFIVDSCIEALSKKPAALEYLRRIGVDPTTAVKLVVASHWHDDHIRGLGTVFEACNSAEIVCSESLQKKEFLTLVTAYDNGAMIDTTGVSEFSQIIRELSSRSDTGGSTVSPRWALADRLLWRQGECEVYSLSPSDTSILNAHRDIAELISKAPKHRLTSKSPNHMAVVLWFRIGGDYSLLLGSDLEETNDATTGWSAILASTTRPRGTACIFKIAHHGSLTGHNDGIWTDLLEEKPLAILTPFVKGRHSIPTPLDVYRILKLAGDAYQTALPKQKKPPRRPAAVEKTIRETVESIRQVQYSSGQVRLRAELGAGSWSVELFGSAFQLKGQERQ